MNPTLNDPIDRAVSSRDLETPVADPPSARIVEVLDIEPGSPPSGMVGQGGERSEERVSNVFREGKKLPPSVFREVDQLQVIRGSGIGHAVQRPLRFNS